MSRAREPLSITLAPEKDTIRLLHLTDPHLFSHADECLLGVNTHASFQAVLNAIKAENVEAELTLCTGDLIQDNHLQGYQHFAQMVKPLNTPVFWLEGNHDAEAMHKYLETYAHIHSAKQILLGTKWQLLLLNSQVIEQPYGMLSKDELQWLASKLAAYPARFSLIALHHNLLPTQSAWLDQHSLKNSDELADILKQFPQVKGILHGHIHQEVDAHWLNYRILATPSTCIQFKPHCDAFTLDNKPQGWREVVLHADGSIESQCKRLKNNDFLPHFEATGY